MISNAKRFSTEREWIGRVPKSRLIVSIRPCNKGNAQDKHATKKGYSSCHEKKNPSPARNRTVDAGIKILSANRYTTEPG